MQIAAFRRRAHTAARFGGCAGFKTGCALIKPNQFVGVDKLGFAVPKRIHPNGRVAGNSLVAQKFTGHQRHVISAGHVVFNGIVQPRAVFKVGVVHPELFRAFVHLADKRVTAAGDIFRERFAGIVGARHGAGFQKVVYAHLLADFQPNLRPAFFGGFFTHRYHIRKRNFAAVNRFGHKQKCHNFGNGRGIQLFVGVLRH